jgi:hypothetical protein
MENVDCVIMFRNTISPRIYLQQLGRCLSAGNDKQPVVFDFVCNYDNLKIDFNSASEHGNNIIHKINDGISDKRKKIIVKTYIKDLEEMIAHIKLIQGTEREKVSEEKTRLIIEKILDGKTIWEIVDIADASCRVITKIAKEHGLTIMSARKKYAIPDEQIKFVMENYEGLTAPQLAKKFANAFGDEIPSALSNARGESGFVSAYSRTNAIVQKLKLRLVTTDRTFINAKTVKQICVEDGSTVMEYKSIAEAQRQFGDTWKIQYAIYSPLYANGTRRSAYGYYWECS